KFKCAVKTRRTYLIQGCLRGHRKQRDKYRDTRKNRNGQYLGFGTSRTHETTGISLATDNHTNRIIQIARAKPRGNTGALDDGNVSSIRTKNKADCVVSGDRK
ncbi:unnamed protein product, partial [Laminaria digitata]